MKQLCLILLLLISVVAASAQQPVIQDTTRKTNTDSIRQADALKKEQQQKAQTQQKQPRKDTRKLKDRIDWDFSTSFWVNRQQVFFDANILVSYKFPKILSIGAGPVYMFTYQKDQAKPNLNGFGGKVFVKAQLLKFLYLWTEYQGISSQHLTVEPATNTFTRSSWYADSWFAGLGVNIRLGRRFGINMSALYDILYYQGQSPYYSDFIYRVGFSF